MMGDIGAWLDFIDGKPGRNAPPVGHGELINPGRIAYFNHYDDYAALARARRRQAPHPCIQETPGYTPPKPDRLTLFITRGLNSGGSGNDNDGSCL